MTGAKEMQVRLVARGCETVLGDAASDSELFLTSDFLTRCMINPQQRTLGDGLLTADATTFLLVAFVHLDI